MTPPNIVDRRGFHLNKGISIEAVISFFALLFAGIGYIIFQDARTTKLEAVVRALHSSDLVAQHDLTELKRDIITRLDRIESWLYEQNGKNGNGRH